MNGKTAKKVHDHARRAALRDLQELNPELYRMLLDGWVKHYKEAYGWSDERPAANKRMAQTRTDQYRVNGRFAKKEEVRE